MTRQNTLMCIKKININGTFGPGGGALVQDSRLYPLMWIRTICMQIAWHHPLMNACGYTLYSVIRINPHKGYTNIFVGFNWESSFRLHCDYNI